jgi:hypothetical protein
MSQTRVFALDLGASLSDLLNDDVRGMSFDHGFDACLLVAGDEHEARGVRSDPIIVRRCELDRLEAARRAALAVEWEWLAHTMLLGACLDPLIDGAKHLFVSRRSFREVHGSILPHGPISYPSGDAWPARAGLRSLRRRAQNPLDRCPSSLLRGSGRCGANPARPRTLGTVAEESHRANRSPRMRVSPRQRGRRDRYLRSELRLERNLLVSPGCFPAATRTAGSSTPNSNELRGEHLLLTMDANLKILLAGARLRP